MLTGNAHLDTLLALLVFAFGLGTLGAGLFTAYFGAGKSRTIGFVLMLLGVIVLLFFSALTWPLVGAIAPVFSTLDVSIALAGLVGALIGGIIAVVVFLVSIMRA